MAESYLWCIAIWKKSRTRRRGTFFEVADLRTDGGISRREALRMWINWSAVCWRNCGRLAGEFCEILTPPTWLDAAEYAEWRASCTVHAGWWFWPGALEVHLPAKLLTQIDVCLCDSRFSILASCSLRLYRWAVYHSAYWKTQYSCTKMPPSFPKNLTEILACVAITHICTH